jgi:hypothetical protein
VPPLSALPGQGSHQVHSLWTPARFEATSAQNQGPRQEHNVIFPKAEARHYSAWTVLLWAPMMLSCQSKQPGPPPQLQPQRAAAEDSWTERAAKISQEELNQLAEYVTGLRHREVTR